MDKVAIEKKVAELKEEVRKYRFDLALNKLKDTSKIRKNKKEIARFFSQLNNPNSKAKQPKQPKAVKETKRK